MQQHIADLASRDSNGHTRMMYHAAYLVQLLHPRHDARDIAHVNEDRHDARPMTPFREQATAEYLGNGDNGRPYNSITYTIIPPSEDPNLMPNTRVNMVALGASYAYGVVNGTAAAKLWIIRVLVPRTCSIGVGYNDIAEFIQTGHLRGRGNLLHVHLCPMAEAMKADFRPAGKHDDIVVSLDLHLMMDRGFRFSLREVPSEYFIAECEHGPSVDGLSLIHI